MMNQKRFMQVTAEPQVGQGERATLVGGRIRGRIIGLLAILLLAGDCAWADFMVQPMLLRLAVAPGRRYVRELKLENSDPKDAELLTLRLAELTQKSDGEWTELRSDDPNLSKATLRSCASWLTLPPNEIKVGPYQIVPFSLQLDVPSQARGFYFAAIIATTAPRVQTLANGALAPVNMQIVVPVILEVQSTPMRQEISLTDTGLEYQPQSLKVDGSTKPAANNLTVDIANIGGTFSRLGTIIRIWTQAGGNHWNRLSEVRFPEYSIMPGANLHLTHNSGLALPSGDYRLEACLYIDGRRGPVIQKIVTFAGDPTLAQTVRSQVALGVQPTSVFSDVIPGATRTTYLQLVNGAEEAVKVDAEVVLPPHMQSATTGAGVLGDELGCQTWVTLPRRSITLKGHGRQTINLLVKMPKEATKYRCYYGTLKLNVSYADGSSAGTKEIMVCVENKKMPEKPVVQAQVLTIAEASPSRYNASASFTNVGADYVNELTCQGVVSVVGAGGGGAAIHKRFLMTSEAYGQTGVLLPIDSRSFSGTLDTSDLPEGDYYVTSILKWNGAGCPADGVQKQITIHVTEQQGRKVARMVDLGGNTGPQVIKL